VFYGEYESRLDDKGRVTIPAKLREAVAEDERADGFMMRPGEDGCVTLYTMKRWNQVEATVNAVAQNTRGARRFRHLMFTQADTGQCDKQGRLRIPGNLLAHAGLTRDCVVAGVSDQIEIWDRARWEAFKAEMYAERERDAEAYGL